MTHEYTLEAADRLADAVQTFLAPSQWRGGQETEPHVREALAAYRAAREREPDGLSDRGA
jgi:hypothetical protein